MNRKRDDATIASNIETQKRVRKKVELGSMIRGKAHSDKMANVLKEADLLIEAAAEPPEFPRSRHEPYAYEKVAAEIMSHNLARKQEAAEEMDEIAATLGEAGLPDGFHRAAAEVFQRISDYKDRDPEEVSLEELLKSLSAPP